MTVTQHTLTLEDGLGSAIRALALVQDILQLIEESKDTNESLSGQSYFQLHLLMVDAGKKLERIHRALPILSTGTGFRSLSDRVTGVPPQRDTYFCGRR